MSDSDENGSLNPPAEISADELDTPSGNEDPSYFFDIYGDDAHFCNVADDGETKKMFYIGYGDTRVEDVFKFMESTDDWSEFRSKAKTERLRRKFVRRIRMRFFGELEGRVVIDPTLEKRVNRYVDLVKRMAVAKARYADARRKTVGKLRIKYFERLFGQKSKQ